jgi:hypothetical protein
LNSENSFIGELTKIGHHFSNKVILKTDVIKKFQLKKIEKDSDDF